MTGLRPKPADWIIIGLLLLCGLGGFWHNLRRPLNPEQRYAAVYLDNRLVVELSFSETDIYTYAFPFGENGEHTAVLEVNGGRLRMLPLDKELCPRSICAHTGWISRSYESIVCLPNRILVVLTASPHSGTEPDLVTY